MTNIRSAIGVLERQVTDPSKGLPEDLFRFITKMTPMVNVDLLIKDEDGRTLLAWRDDPDTGTGWHVPGGIVRFKERMPHRIEKVAEVEIGAMVEFDPTPIAVKEIILEKKIRGHFISFLYSCRLSRDFTPDNGGLAESDAGYLRWHEACPSDLLQVHEVYRTYIDDVVGSSELIQG